jgi:hypothetical protein
MQSIIPIQPNLRKHAQMVRDRYQTARYRLPVPNFLFHSAIFDAGSDDGLLLRGRLSPSVREICEVADLRAR